MKLQEGDVFSIRTVKGVGFLQYITTFDNGVEYIRVLQPIKSAADIEQEEVDIQERFCIQFPVKAAKRKKIIEKLGTYSIPSTFRIARKARTKHSVRGEFLGWHIVDINTLQRETKQKLSDSDLALSPHGIFNDTLIVEYLETDWKLKEWK